MPDRNASPLRIGIDATTVGIRDVQRGGVYQYVWQVLARLAARGHDLRLLFALPHPRHRASIRERVTELPGRVWPVRTPLPERWLRRSRLPVELFVGRVDVFHAPAHLNLASLRVPTVVTVHDLAFLACLADAGPRNPADADADSAEARHRAATRQRFFSELRRQTERSLATAARIITVSEATRSELLRHFAIAPDKVRVVHLGVRAGMRPVADGPPRRALCRRLGIDAPFWLYVGVLDPNKNLATVLEAYAHYRRRGGRRLLVLAGHDDFHGTSLRALAERLGVGAQVRFPGFVDDADLPGLYSAATAVLMPSPHEGFGIPAIEAMACGTPVIAAAARALPEVVGAAGLLVDPCSAQAFATAFAQLDDDPALVARLCVAGMERAKSFDWERTVDATLAVYREAARAS